MTDEHIELVNDWKTFADKVKTNREWESTEEAKAEKDALLNRTYEFMGL